eukprot:scaffold45607_cov237-Amphora_coffeaeformis.AAC.9
MKKDMGKTSQALSRGTTRPYSQRSHADEGSKEGRSAARKDNTRLERAPVLEGGSREPATRATPEIPRDHGCSDFVSLWADVQEGDEMESSFDKSFRESIRGIADPMDDGDPSLFEVIGECTALDGATATQVNEK